MVPLSAIDWIVPPAVRPGDVVAVCAPSGPIVPARFARGLELLAPHLALRVPDAIATAKVGYLAGDDARRTDELVAALRDPDVRAIVLARGGYGLSRILAGIDPDLLARDPKPIVGFSDATALLAWAAGARVRAIHGPVVSQLGDLDGGDVAALVRALTDPRPLGTAFIVQPLVGAAPCAGALAPGNLKMLAHLCGTPWQLDATGALLLIEEVGERPYALDRDLTQLALAGGLRGAAGVVLGDLVRCLDVAGSPDDPTPARAVLAERLAQVGLPAWWDAPVGHGKRNLALPFGARAELDADGSFAILDAAVR